MLLGKIDSEFVKDVACVALQRAIQGSITIHDNEAKCVVILEQFMQSFGVEFVVAQVQRRVNRFEGLEGYRELLLLALVGHDGAAVQHQAVLGDLCEELQFLLSRCDSSQHGQSGVSE